VADAPNPNAPTTNTAANTANDANHRRPNLPTLPSRRQEVRHKGNRRPPIPDRSQQHLEPSEPDRALRARRTFCGSYYECAPKVKSHSSPAVAFGRLPARTLDCGDTIFGLLSARLPLRTTS